MKCKTCMKCNSSFVPKLDEIYCNECMELYYNQSKRELNKKKRRFK